MSGPPAVSPCGACKFLRRKCTRTCIFAPHFPPDQGQRFANVHRIFGASNVAKLLQELPPPNREDAVNSLSYEADARVNDPIYGCVGALFSLQQQVARLQTELAMAQAELARVHAAQAQSQAALPLGGSAEPGSYDTAAVSQLPLGGAAGLTGQYYGGAYAYGQTAVTSGGDESPVAKPELDGEGERQTAVTQSQSALDMTQ